MSFFFVYLIIHLISKLKQSLRDHRIKQAYYSSLFYNSMASSNLIRYWFISLLSFYELNYFFFCNNVPLFDRIFRKYNEKWTLKAIFFFCIFCTGAEIKGDSSLPDQFMREFEKVWLINICLYNKYGFKKIQKLAEIWLWNDHHESTCKEKQSALFYDRWL